MSAVESALGDAYSEPATEVREFVESMKQAASGTGAEATA
jgi:hypothetical protein